MIALLLTVCALAQEPAAQSDFQAMVDQARFFLKKDWYQDAAGELEAAVATEDGRLDHDAWFLLASVRFEL